MRKLLAISCVGLAVAVTGCSGARSALGLTKVSPDEFRVVTKAPLTLPPDYALRPPEPGKPRPQEQAPEAAARVAIMGSAGAVNRSAGEDLLVSMAGANRVDPNIRFVVDEEGGNLAYKPSAFANMVMFWQPGGAEAAPINADAEAKRIMADSITAATANKPVVIQRSRAAGFKLPGL